MPDTPRVLIAGAGIGGLALAQALHSGGLDVAVYEKDPTPQTRNQGYRLHIDADGNAALRACVPAPTFDLVRRTSGTNDDVLGMYTHELEQVMVQHFPDLTDDVITNVDRNVFRRGLLTDLDGVVRFGHTLTRYEITETGRVRAHFAEGGTDEGDLLVGTDGVGSAVRRQLLPHATVRDLGVRCVYGRMALTPEHEALYPAAIRRGFNWISDGTGYGAGFAPVRFRSPCEGATDYTMVTLLARPERFGVPDEELFAMPPEDLWKLTVTATAEWHPELREIFTHAEPATFFPIALRAGERIPAWPSGPVTLLGDAIHTMPPTGGVGANTALQDAATLATELLTAARGDKPLPEAVATYESVMLPRGFDTIDASLRMATQMFGTID
ncbi:FAD-dependent oxidoreductase [Nocardia blacklockiae]|uniref:FAD-dependent oxidoreductase n=1 Tax=Nocardia blacklockiae TaxID=480036 RepID=UPI00189421B3|nr:NAD(P)/FAD-dependent oxidoreductase [Nocardia blacklockiae]MBF6174047.1 FAD-dependent monooxygenase [Nocardia blacklockiae]